MANKITIWHNLKKNVAYKEKAYDLALEKLEIMLSRMNKGIIHGKKEEGCINTLKITIDDLTHASFEYELANHKLSSFLKHGVISYE